MIHLLDHDPRNRRAEILTATMHRTNRGKDGVGTLLGLKEISANPCTLDRFHYILAIAVLSNYENPDAGNPARELVRGAEAVCPAHHDVEQNDLRIGSKGDLECGFAVNSLAHDLAFRPNCLL